MDKIIKKETPITNTIDILGIHNPINIGNKQAIKEINIPIYPLFLYL